MTNTSTVLYAVAVSLALSLAGCGRKSKPAVHVAVTMKKYSISPAEIRVRRGETVELEVATADVQHGFDVPELGVKESVQPGRPAIFAITPDRKGEFTIECGVLCGPHHDD